MKLCTHTTQSLCWKVIGWMDVSTKHGMTLENFVSHYDFTLKLTKNKPSHDCSNNLNCIL